MAATDAPSQPICPLGVSERTLSALRDDALSSTQAARLAAHAEGCAACQERLSNFEEHAALLRSEHPPAPDGRLWRSVAAEAGSSPRIRRPRFSGIGAMRPSRSSLGALAAALLLTAGFVALLGLRHPTPPGQPTPTATPAPTHTPVPTETPIPTATPDLLPAHPLIWQPVGPADQLQTYALANDGETAYKCSVVSDAQGNAVLNIWHTSDRGAHWIPARSLAPAPSVNGCLFVVDASDPSVAALAWQPRGGGAGDSYTGLMTTVDGGVTWQDVPSEPFTRIDQLDSRGGVIYALRETANSGNSVEFHLWASADRMRTWRQVDHGLPTYLAGFWLQPDGASILAVVSGDPTSASSQLWSSPDDGATWKQLAFPGDLPQYMPARFAAFGENSIMTRWVLGQLHICVSNATVRTQADQPAEVTCSSDGGATWHARPLLLVTNAHGDTGAVNLVAIADDGALLASGLATLYRLPAGADRWQSLGPLPQLAVAYCPAPGAGILWAGPGVGTPLDPQNRIFTANYAP